MGTSWTIAITLTSVDRPAWLRSKADPKAYDDWPPLLAHAAESKPVAVSKLFAELEKRCHVRVDWTYATARQSDLRVAAVVSNDDSFWIDRRTLLAAAVRAASAHGAEGDVCVVNALDNTADTGLVVTAGGGVNALTGAKRKALQKQLRALEEDLVDADATRAAAAWSARRRPGRRSPRKTRPSLSLSRTSSTTTPSSRTRPSSVASPSTPTG